MDQNISETVLATEATERKKKPIFGKRQRPIGGLEKESGVYTYIAAFMLPFLIMLGVYACLGKHPFGNNSVLTLDLQAQYIYYYEAIRRLMVEGGSWLYSFERTLGGEFMGIVSYYGASPFNIIFLLFPKEMLADAIMFVQLAKVGAMGVTFSYYLRKTRDTSDMLTVSCAIMYALSAYSVVQLMNPMWLDAMVFAPLLVLGIEKMIRQRKFALYTISLVMIMVTNYYIGYMCCIFTFFYFLYYYFLVRDELAQNEGALSGNFVKRLFRSRGFETLMRFGIFSVLAAVIAAFMLICGIYSLQFGKSDFSNPDYSLSLRFDFLDLFIKLLPGSYDTVRPNGLPMIYSGTLALIALPLFFMSKTISAKKKALTGGLLGFFVISFMVNTVDLAWHGFSSPNWLNYRYSFLFSFVLIVIACDALRGLKKIPYSWIASVGTVIALLVMVIQKLDISFQQTDTRKNPLDDAKCILVSLVLIGMYLFVLRYMKYDHMERSGAFALAIVICVEMFATALITVGEIQSDVGSVKYDNYLSESGKTEYYDGYRGSIRRIEDVVNEVLEGDTGLYRMESTVYRRLGGVNEPMAFGFNGISHSTSTLDADVIDFMSYLGYASQSHWTKYIGGTPVSDALLGIKYVITKNDTLDPEFYTVAAEGPEEYKYIPTTNTIYAMQNTKALSLVYGVSPALLEMDTTSKPYFDSSISLQNEIVNTMLSGVLESNPDVFKGIYSPQTYENVYKESYPHNFSYLDENGAAQLYNQRFNVYKLTDKSKEGTIRYYVEVETDGPLYFYAPGYKFADTATKCAIYVNGSKKCDYFGNETWVIQDLGDFEAGDIVEVEIVFEGGNLYISGTSPYLFYSINYEAANQALSQLSYASMYVEEHGNDYLKGTIDLPEGQELIFTTIPYDKGWKVTIDGEEVETVEVLNSLMAIPSTAGFHEIELIYRPDSVMLGMALSVIGIVIFVAILFVSVYLKKKGRVTPEGTVHFIYCKGDAEPAWALEMKETEAAMRSDVLPLPEVPLDDETPEEAEAPEKVEAPEEEEASEEEPPTEEETA